MYFSGTGEEEMKMICPKCGIENESENKFCKNCGAQLEIDEDILKKDEDSIENEDISASNNSSENIHTESNKTFNKFNVIRKLNKFSLKQKLLFGSSLLIVIGIIIVIVIVSIVKVPSVEDARFSSINNADYYLAFGANGNFWDSDGYTGTYIQEEDRIYLNTEDDDEDDSTSSEFQYVENKYLLQVPFQDCALEKKGSQLRGTLKYYYEEDDGDRDVETYIFNEDGTGSYSPVYGDDSSFEYTIDGNLISMEASIGIVGHWELESGIIDSETILAEDLGDSDTDWEDTSITFNSDGSVSFYIGDTYGSSEDMSWREENSSYAVYENGYPDSALVFTLEKDVLKLKTDTVILNFIRDFDNDDFTPHSIYFDGETAWARVFERE